VLSAFIQDQIRDAEILAALDRAEEELPRLPAEARADANPLAPLVEELAGALADQTSQSRLLLEVVRSLSRASEPASSLEHQRCVAGTLLAGRLTFEEARGLLPHAFEEAQTAVIVALCLSVLSRGIPIEEAKRAILAGAAGRKPGKEGIGGAKEALRALISEASDPGTGEARVYWLETNLEPLIELGRYNEARSVLSSLYADIEDANAANVRARAKISKILRDVRARSMKGNQRGKSDQH
jgi:hypothetical protein